MDTRCVIDEDTTSAGGENAMIAAGAVVTKDVEPNTIFKKPD